MNSYGGMDDRDDVNGQGCLQPMLFVCVCLLAFFACCLMGWFLRLDATLEGDATIYAREPVEHCSLKPEP